METEFTKYHEVYDSTMRKIAEKLFKEDFQRQWRVDEIIKSSKGWILKLGKRDEMATRHWDEDQAENQRT